MKIIIKTVKAIIGEFEVTPEQTVLQLKQQIAENQDTTPECVSLIYKSKMLKDDTQTLEQVKIQDGDNVVIVMKKAAQTAKPAAKPAPVAQPAAPAQPAPQAAPAPEVAPQQPTQPAQDAVNIFQETKPAEAAPAVVEPSQDDINMLVNMGFKADDARKALRKANNQIDIAANMLLEGVDLDSIPDPSQRTGRAAPSHDAGMDMGLGTKEEFIQQVLANPAQFEIFFQQIDNINPQVGQLARSNPGMLYDILTQTMQQQQGMPQQGYANPPQQPRYQQPPQAAPAPAQPTGGLQLTAEDEEVINRLMQLGFSRQQAVQAYIAGEKNENYAANLLLDGMI